MPDSFEGSECTSLDPSSFVSGSLAVSPSRFTERITEWKSHRLS